MAPVSVVGIFHHLVDTFSKAVAQLNILDIHDDHSKRFVKSQPSNINHVKLLHQ
jgi:hypothetical protein